MKTRTTTSAYSEWRRTQEWLGDWLVALDQGRVAIPPGAPIRRALGLAARAKERDVLARLRSIAAQARPKDGDTLASLARLVSLRTILSAPEEQEDEASTSFLCAFCGEPTPIEIDPEDGQTQTFTMDCSVCCRPNVIHLLLATDGSPRSLQALPEQE